MELAKEKSIICKQCYAKSFCKDCTQQSQYKYDDECGECETRKATPEEMLRFEHIKNRKSIK